MTLSRPFAHFALTLGLLGALLSAPIAAGASNLPSVTAILKAANAQMLKETSVHIEVVSVNKTTSSTIKVNLGVTKGAEYLQSNKMKVAIVVTPQAAYLSGNKLGLTTVMGLTSVQQSKIGTKWMKMLHGTSPYTNLAKNLTTAVFSRILPQVKGTKVSTSSDKAKDFQLSWTTAAGAASATKNVLLISSGAKRLPISQTITTSAGHGTTKYSKWGKGFTLTVPRANDTVTYKAVFG